MASNALISTFAARSMPFLAILRHDLRTLRESWLVRIWAVGSALLTLLLATGGWKQLPTAPLVASLLLPYLVFPWFLVVMVLGVNPVSGSRVDALADGFLSRPVTRYEYLLAIWASRVVAVLGVYLLVMVPAVAIVALAARGAPPDRVTLYGVLGALGVVGLVMVLQVSLGFLVGILLRRPLAAIVLLLFFWYPVNLLLHTFRLESFSPISLSQSLPTLLRQPWRADESSKGPPDALDWKEVQRRTSEMLGMFSGETPPEPNRGFFDDQDKYRGFSLLRVVLGYGLPTLGCVALAAIVFSRRDL
jgi:ABC-type transport system involved in multi-copper enzyme maturation permease subunit